MPASTVTIIRDGEEIDLLAEYDRTPFYPAETSWGGGYGSPAEGGEAENLTVTLDGQPFTLTQNERLEIYDDLDTNPEDK